MLEGRKYWNRFPPIVIVLLAVLAVGGWFVSARINQSPDVASLEAAVRDARVPDGWRQESVACPDGALMCFRSDLAAREALAQYEPTLEAVLDRSLEVRCDIRSGRSVGCQVGTDVDGVIVGASADTLPSEDGDYETTIVVLVHRAENS